MGACVHHTYGCTRGSPWSASSSSSSTGASALSNLGFFFFSPTWGILAFCRPSTGQTSDQEAWGRSNGWARGHVRRHSARGHTTHAAGDGDATIGRSRARGAHEVERKRRRISRTDKPGQVKLARGRKSRQTNRRVHVRVLVCIYASKLKVVSLKVVSFRTSGRDGAFQWPLCPSRDLADVAFARDARALLPTSPSFALSAAAPSALCRGHVR